MSVYCHANFALMKDVWAKLWNSAARMKIILLMITEYRANM